MTNTFAARLFYCLLITGLIPVAVMINAMKVHSERTAEENSLLALQSTADDLAHDTRRLLDEATATMTGLAEADWVSQPAPQAAAEARIAAAMTRFPALRAVSLRDRVGSVLASAPRGDRSTRWLPEEVSVPSPQHPMIFWAEPSGGERSFALHVLLRARPPAAATPDTERFLCATIAADALASSFRSARTGAAGGAFLVDAAGRIITASPQTVVSDECVAALARGGWTLPASGTRDFRGLACLYHLAPVAAGPHAQVPGWHIITLAPREQAVSVVLRNQWFLAGAGACALGASVLLGMLLSSRTTRHLSHAAAAARKIAAGDLAVQLAESGPLEMSGLARAFNDMTADLRTHRHHLEDIVRDRTRALEDARHEHERTAAQLRAACEASREGLLVIGCDGRLIMASQLVHVFFGTGPRDADDVEAWLARVTSRFADPDIFSGHWCSMPAAAAGNLTVELEVAQPVRRVLCIYTAPVRTEAGEIFARLWTFRDITERRRLEDSLRQAQKMEAVGRLAGGVAHDFNNLLQAIIGNIQLMDQVPDGAAPPEERGSRIAMALNAGQRASQIVRQLLGFSRQSPLDLRLCSPADVVRDVMELGRHTVDKKVQILADIAPDTWPIRADENQIEQVLMNMLVNARDAMPQGGAVKFSTRNATLTAADQPPGLDLPPGDYVCLTVADNGTGMDAATKERIFEPFFTTKEQGKGTGLGLATSFGIIQQHGGSIVVESEQGLGTTFRIFIPRCAGTPAPSPLPFRPPADLSQPPSGGHETILLVDDEVIVRNVAEGVLKQRGYRVLTADDGEEALALLAAYDGAVDLAVLDMTMPRLGGRETFAAMRRGVGRHVPVVICSGHLIETDSFAEEVGSRPDAVLQKPYAIEDLLHTVRRVIDSQDPARGTATVTASPEPPASQPPAPSSTPRSTD